MLIREVLARVFVDSIDDALPLYEELADGAPVRRFTFGEAQLARVGPFLLLSGPPDSLAHYRDRAASVIVTDVTRVAEAVTASGGELIDGPAPAPNGIRLIARHQDGSVFEYLQIVGRGE